MKFILILIFIISLSNRSFAQCDINTSATSLEVVCGQSVDLSAFGSSTGSVVLDEDFNTGGFGPGWSGTPGSTNFSNPCSPGGVDGTPHAWMDNNTSVPRTLTSSAYDLSGATAGVTVCFDLLFAVQGGAAPCEGPDEPDEGVFLQYSTDGGTTWIDIFYFDPNGGNDPQLTNWNNYCFSLPPGAITGNTLIRWHQTADSGADYDHWGIDNVQIFQNDINSEVVWLHDGYSYGVGSAGGVNPTSVTPTSTTTYTAQITTGTGDVCTSDITIVVLAPNYDINVSASPTTICSGDCSTITGTGQIVVDPGGLTVFENNETDLITGSPGLPGFPPFIPPSPGAITADMNINVVGINQPTVTSGLITTVCINDFTIFPGGGGSTSLADVEIILTCPSGAQITLVNVGDISGNTITNMCFVVGGPPVSGGSDPYTGTFNPAQPFDNLIGCDADGVWNLTISGAVNDFSIPFGSIGGWSITFDNPPIFQTVDYSWGPTTGLSNPNDINTTACPTSTTTYTLTATNGVPGCPTQDEVVTIVVDPCGGCVNPVLNDTPVDVSCSGGNDGSIDLTITGTSTYGILWSNGPTTEDISGLTAGSYTVTVTDQADATCTVTTSIVIGPGATVPTGTISGGGTICGAGTADIIMNFTGTANWSFDYTLDGIPQATVSNISANPSTYPLSTPGVYVVTGVSDASGCPGTVSGTATIVVNTPVDPLFDGLSAICAGDALAPLPTTSNNGITGTWSPAMDNMNTTLYTFTPTAGQCANTASLTVVVNPVVNPTFALVAPICTGDGLAALPTTSTNGITGAWSPAINNTATTTYTFTPTGGQCANTATMTIDVNPTFSSNKTESVCEGDNFTYADGTVSVINANESHTSNLLTTLGCDSTIIENITMIPDVSTTSNASVCSGNNFIYADGTIATNITVNESHISNLTTLNGCDSIVTENVTVLPNVTNTVNVNVCSGGNYTYADGTTSTNITVNENNVSTLLSGSGCDSVVTENITVLPNVTNTVNVDLCAGSNYTYADGSTSTNILVNESNVSTLVSGVGCDSVVTENINIVPAITNTLTVNVCSGDNFTYADGTVANNITVNESNVSTLISGSGCDSLVTENIVVDPTYNLTENVNACENSTYIFPDGSSQVIAGNTSYTSNLTTTSGCDSTINTVLTMDPIVSNTVNNSICTGTNFTYADGVVSNNITVAESHLSTLVSGAGCDSLVTENIAILPNVTNAVNTSICSGTNFTYADGTVSNNITVNESHVSTLVSGAGCDSVLTENITVLPLITNAINANVCSGANFTYADGTVSTNITVAESYVSTLVAGNGCDSLLTENLSVVPAITNTINADVCSGSNFTYADGTVSTNILVNESNVSTLVSSGGCDSLVTENLNVVPAITNILNIDLCSGSNFTYADGTTSTNITVNENNVTTLVSSGGCDSIVTENINVLPNVTNTLNVSLCSSSNYTYADGTTSSNILANESNVTVLVSGAGCDSTITENITILPIITNTANASVCSGDNFTYADGTVSNNITIAENHVSVLVATSGCDSTVTENIAVNPIFNLTENVSACENTNFTYPDGTISLITGNESHTSNLFTVSGCDSTINTILTMDPIVSNSVTIDICLGSNYTYADGVVSNGILVNENHISTLVSGAGCDSLLTENLNIVPSINVTVNVDLCTGSSYTYADGSTSTNILVNENNVSTLVSVGGCDSIVTENINVLPNVTTTVNNSVCSGTAYTYADGTVSTNITINESHASVLVSGAGCDSTVTENITVNPVFNLTENVNTCENSIYTYPDGTTSTITANETHISNLLTTSGCDSIITTNVTMDPNFNSTENIAVCTGGSFTYPDGMISNNITLAESHTSNLIASTGCDSVITSFVSVNPDYNFTNNFDICSGSNFTYADGTNATGVLVNESHASVLITSAGCDSTITENLNVLPAFNLTDNITVCEGTVVTYPDGTTATITSNTSQTSTLTTSTGCDSIIVTTVTMEPLPTFTLNSTGPTACGLSDGTITIGGLIANTPYDVSYNSGAIATIMTDGSGNILFTGLATGSYTDFTVSSTFGCTTIDNTVINISPLVAPSIDNVSIIDLSCAGDASGEIHITASGGTGSISFEIDNGTVMTNATGDFIGLSAGTYDITIMDGIGCESTDQIMVIEPGSITQNVNSTDVLCFGDANGTISWINVTGGTPPYQYSIDNGATYTPGILFIGLVAGTYNVTVQDFNGCNSSILPVVVDEPNELLLTSSNVPITEPSCVGGNPACNGVITVNIPSNVGTAPFTYIWPNGIAQATTNTAVGLCGGQYNIAVQDFNGCLSNVQVYLNIPVVPSIVNVTTSDAGCDNACTGGISIISTNTTNITINGVQEDSTGIYTGLCADSYAIVVSNQAGCTASQTAVVNSPNNPIANFLTDPLFGTIVDPNISFINISEFASTYSWIITSLPGTPAYIFSTTDEEFDHQFPSEEGQYYICLTAFSDAGCQDEICRGIIIKPEHTMYVPNAFTPDGDPFNQSFKAVMGGIDPFNFEMLIFDRWGELLFESNNSEVGWDGRFQGEFVQDGVYVWQITYKLSNTDERIVKRGHVTMLR